ncbi:hypothetical protein S58_32930 [Bradyrhizobium oligotrophicum S58]|uniref:Uncharacterized protein n=1 Tax=Bradyrhizobium oligotrophicum S58 TaxID=1245469 RepID=M4ZSP6_9BRAD|nr:hypothetical protein S58_32930 [Bradyrhizobium oligotrophicum S58]
MACWSAARLLRADERLRQDDEIAASWRPDAGAKFESDALCIARTTVANEPDTGETAYKS